ncbi:MAG: DNA-3-methyladenine glycosylase [Candidatus Colwellbacteria bacterium]|nr:DNA-3-methyladenine glycosylase [Candidatus Colwellbacteria bacterium]
MRRTLKQEFFGRPTLEVAQDLLGKFLVRRFRDKLIASEIVEVEAYDGFRDKASHASRGLTARNKVMFGEAGHWYIYFTYGMHWMLNIVVGPENYPAAVLIRGVKGITGPGRLTKYFKIGGGLNGRECSRKSALWIEDRGVRIASKNMKRTKRVGVDYAGKYWANRRWRFIDRET